MRSTLRAVPATVPDPFLNHALISGQRPSPRRRGRAGNVPFRQPKVGSASSGGTRQKRTSDGWAASARIGRFLEYQPANVSRTAITLHFSRILRFRQGSGSFFPGFADNFVATSPSAPRQYLAAPSATERPDLSRACNILTRSASEERDTNPNRKRGTCNYRAWPAHRRAVVSRPSIL